MNLEKQNKVKSGTASSRRRKGKSKKKPKQQSGVLKINTKPIAQQRHKARRAGNRIIMYDPSSKDKDRFKKESAEFAPKHPLEGAISVSMVFSMPRPRSHYRGGRFSHLLKGSSPNRHISRPDLDNIIKFYLDAMTGMFWKDDAYVCTIEASKNYSKQESVEIEYWNCPE